MLLFSYLIMKKNTIKQIAAILAKQLGMSKTKAELYALRVYVLYSDISREYSLVEDPNVIADDLSNNLLTLNTGLGRYARSGIKYLSTDDWWWYMEPESPICRAISIRTGEILEEDDIALETRDGELPALNIDIYSTTDDKYRGEVSVSGDDNPWLSSMLRAIDCRGESEDEVIDSILAGIRRELSQRYPQQISVLRENCHIYRWVA